jgi:hypothetical protein
LRLTGTLNAVRAVSFNATGEVRLAGNVQGATSLMICSESAGPVQARQVTLQAGRALQLQQGLATACV